MKQLLKGILSISILLMCTTISEAATRTFTGPGFFSDPTKWDGGTTLPAAGDDIQIFGTCNMVVSTGLVYGGTYINDNGSIVTWPGVVYTCSYANGAVVNTTLDMSNGGTFAVTSYFSQPVNFIAGTGSIQIYSGSYASVYAPGPFNNLEIFGTAPGAYVSTVYDITILGNFINHGVEFRNNRTIQIEGDWTDNGTHNTTLFNGTIIFNGCNGDQYISGTGTIEFYNLT